MYNELLFEIWEQDKINRKGKTTVTNFDKVKELITLDKINLDMSEIDICSIIHTVRKEQTCIDRSCNECYKWLKEKYKEPILTDKEREYLSAVIKPFKNDVQIIKKMETTCDPEESETYIPKEYIVIITKEFDNAVLPCFEKGKCYKGMETTDGYTLEELGL